MTFGVVTESAARDTAHDAVVDRCPGVHRSTIAEVEQQVYVVGVGHVTIVALLLSATPWRTGNIRNKQEAGRRQDES